VGTYCYVAVRRGLLGGTRRFGAHRGRRRAGHIVAAPAQLVMPPPLIGGGIKRCFCLTSVCLTSVAYIGPKSRTEKPMKTKIGTEVAHVTRDSDTTFRVKGRGHQAASLSATLTRKAAAAVSVGTYSAWESTATLRLLGGARGAWAPTG